MKPKKNNPIPQPSQRPKLQQSITSYEQSTMRLGPLPDPDDLFRYNDIIPNGADRIMIMAEKNQDARIKNELITIKSQARSILLGQIFAMVVVAIFAFLTYLMLISGYPWPGSILGSTTLVGLVYIFVTGRKPPLPK